MRSLVLNLRDLREHVGLTTAARTFVRLVKEGRLFSRLFGHLNRIPLGRADLGDFARTKPISEYFGFDRGQPVDRLFIDDFLERRRDDIRGRVLEIGDNAYTLRFGGERVTRSDILHVDADNPKATLVGDIAQPGVLPEAAFDCIVLTQTLHLIFDMPRAVEHLWRALAPGGVLLITVPGASSIDREEWGATWYWSLTRHSLLKLMEPHAPDAETTTYGNVFAACAFLHGLCVEELPAEKLMLVDEAYPVVVAVRAVKRADA